MLANYNSSKQEMRLLELAGEKLGKQARTFASYLRKQCMLRWEQAGIHKQKIQERHKCSPRLALKKMKVSCKPSTVFTGSN